MAIKSIILLCGLVLLTLCLRIFLHKIRILWKSSAISVPIVAFASWVFISFEIIECCGNLVGFIASIIYVTVISLCMYMFVEHIGFHTKQKGSHQLDPDNLAKDEDWIGNNAAFRCPVCSKVYIVTTFQPVEGKRECPNCKKSTAYIDGGKKSNGSAKIEWET